MPELNFDDIVKMLIDNNGKHHEEIRDKYGMSHKKPISRLWNEIIEEVHADIDEPQAEQTEHDAAIDLLEARDEW